MRTVKNHMTAVMSVIACALMLVAFPIASTAATSPGGTCTGEYADGDFFGCGYDGSDGNDGTNTGTGTTGPAAPPTCDLDGRTLYSSYKNPSAQYCSGKNICVDVDLFAPNEMPEGPKPREDSVARVTLCGPVIGPPVVTRIFWSGQEEPPTLAEQAQTAVAALDFTTPTVTLSPAARTLVNFDTWFWLPDAQQEVTASAFTLVATARLRSMTVDAGDGSGTFTCTPVPATSDEAAKNCTHQYRKASLRGSETVNGRPAYRATVSTVYDLTFTNGGDPIKIDGAPTTIDGAPASTAVRVDEVQSIVQPNR